VKPSYGLNEEQVEAMIRESFEKAEEDLRERQLREACVEADNILIATEKAQHSEAWSSLTAQEQAAVEAAKRAVREAYGGNDYHVLNEKLELLNKATLRLAENMMNSAVRGALKGTKIE
jgi:molecular chaperone DnaK (HSP70)